jgi:6-phosphogluconolactonase
MRTAFLLPLLSLFFALSARGEGPVVFVSSFAGGEAGVIHALEFDLKSGALKPLKQTGGVANPFFLALSSDGKYLYSNNSKSFGGPEQGEVAAFEIIGRTGELKALNRSSAKGTVTCYVDIDAAGRAAVAANYGSGSTVSFPVKADGTLGEAASFFEHLKPSDTAADAKVKSHAHAAVIGPDNKYVYVPDLGLNRVFVYRLDAATAKLTPNEPPYAEMPAGAGPRHLTFHPGGKFAYVINEYGNSVTVLDYDGATGAVTPKQTLSTLPADFTGKSFCADVKVTPDGRFLYGTNRGHDSIAIYSINDDGTLKLVGIEPSLGKGPQNLAITADGAWLLCANMPGKNVAVFRIDAKAGTLKSAGAPTELASPSCIMVLE